MPTARGESTPRRSDWTLPTVLLLAGITVVALALRLPSFSDSWWGDELSTNYVVHGFGVGNVLDIVRSDQEGTPPLFFLLAWLTKGFDGTEGLRVVSLLVGLGTIPLTYVLGRRTVGRPAATVAAVLVALSPFQIFYATEGRAYALVMFLCLLASVLLLIALEKGRWWWWTAYGLTVAAAIYTHYNAIFVILVLFVWAFFARPEARLPLLLANAGAAVLFAPWLGEFITDTNSPAAKIGEVLSPLSVGSVKHDLVQWGVGHPFIASGDMPGDPARWLIAGGLILGVIGLGLARRAAPAPRWTPPARVVLAVSLALAAPVGALVWSLFASSIFVPRALITSWPGLAVSIGALVTAPRSVPLRIAATGLVAAGFAIGAVKMLDDQNQRPDLHGVVSFIERTGPTGSPVVDVPQLTPGPQTNLEAAFAPKGEPLPPDWPILTLNFPTFHDLLEVRKEGRPVLAPLPVPSDAAIAHQAARMAGRGRIFLVTWGTAPLDVLRRVPGPVAGFMAALPPRFHEVEFRTFPGLSFFDEAVHVLDGGAAGLPSPSGSGT